MRTRSSRSATRSRSARSSFTGSWSLIASRPRRGRLRDPGAAGCAPPNFSRLSLLTGDAVLVTVQTTVRPIERAAAEEVRDGRPGGVVASARDADAVRIPLVEGLAVRERPRTQGGLRRERARACDCHGRHGGCDPSLSHSGFSDLDLPRASRGKRQIRGPEGRQCHGRPSSEPTGVAADADGSCRRLDLPSGVRPQRPRAAFAA